MANQFTIDIDSITQETAKRICGFLLALTDVEHEPQPEIQKNRITEVSPEEVFSKLSDSAPVLEFPASSVPAETTGVQTDKDGIPWDARIHSANKTLNADGTWRTKRGLNEGTQKQVENELRQVMAIPNIAPPPPATTPVTSQAPPPPPTPEAPLVQDNGPFLNLVGRVSAAVASGIITYENVAEICQSVDPALKMLPLLANRLDLVPAVSALIDGLIAGKKA